MARRRRSESAVYNALLAQDDALKAAGWPALSPWWKTTLGEFYATRRGRLVARVGRRGGKSSTLCRVAVAEALHGDHAIKPGDVGVFGFVSTKIGEAKERLRTIRQILEVLGVEHKALAEEIRLNNDRMFKVYPASFRTAVGMTLIGLAADEVARWRDDETDANPATEVLRSMRPALATQINAHEFLSSSPWSTIDAHAEAFALGDTEAQLVRRATTWEANPTLTIARCRELEPDEATFQREYGAEPMASGAAAFFDGRAVDDCFSPEAAGPTIPGDWLAAGADFGFRRDSSALAVTRHRGDIATAIEICELRPSTVAPLRPSETVATFAGILRAHRLGGLMADGHYREAIVEFLCEHGLAFFAGPTDVAETYVRFRVLLHQGRLRLPANEGLRRDLHEVNARPTASGSLSIELPRRPGGGHADIISALVLACWQKGGTVVTAANDVLAGWTQDEIDALHRRQERIRGKRDTGQPFYRASSIYR